MAVVLVGVVVVLVVVVVVEVAVDLIGWVRASSRPAEGARGKHG